MTSSLIIFPPTTTEVAGIATPASWVPSELTAATLPSRLFIKPRDGSASLHIYCVDRDHLPDFLPLVPNPMIQEVLQGTEITIDALIDFEGALLHYVPRVRLRTMAGESIQGRTISDSEIRDWLIECLDIAARMGARGPITLQAFLTPKDQCSRRSIRDLEEVSR